MNKTTHLEVFQRVLAEAMVDSVEVRGTEEPYFYSHVDGKGSVCAWAEEYFDISDKRNLKSFIDSAKSSLLYHLCLLEEVKTSSFPKEVVDRLGGYWSADES